MEGNHADGREYCEKHTTIVAIAALTAFTLVAAICQAKSADEAKIEELEAAFAAAFNAKSVDAVMKVYVPDESSWRNGLSLAAIENSVAHDRNF